MKKLLIVDDDLSMRTALSESLESCGYAVETAENGAEGLNRFRENTFDAVITDMRMPKMSGMDVLRGVKRISFGTPVVVITAYGTVNTAVEAMKEGAADFIMKPFSLDDLECVVKNVLNARPHERGDDSEASEERVGPDFEIITRNRRILSILDILKTVAKSKSSVLIQGESGTGKELFARFLYRHSNRRNMPFVAVNCAAIPHNLLESEMFGYEKGAFTGAMKSKPGKFELADGGTIFLDEVGDMSLKTQSKVLRVLEEGEVQKVGSNKISKVDVRVIAATNKDLKAEIEKNLFRSDLYFRLNVLPLSSPPLREKREDIPVLIDYFARMFAEENNFKVKTFSPEAVEVMTRCSWKGNVRELRNVVERLLIMTEGDRIEKSDLPEQIRGEKGVVLPDASKVQSLKDFRDLAEREFLLAKLEANGWNISRTAREIDTPRSNLYKKLEQYGIKITAGVDETVAPESVKEEGEESPDSAGQGGR